MGCPCGNEADGSRSIGRPQRSAGRVTTQRTQPPSPGRRARTLGISPRKVSQGIRTLVRMDFFDTWDVVHALSGRRVRAVMVCLLAVGLMTATGQRLFTAAVIRKGESISREFQQRLCATGTPTFAAFCAVPPTPMPATAPIGVGGWPRPFAEVGSVGAT